MNQPLAYIHPDAKIARNVVVEPFTTIQHSFSDSLGLRDEHGPGAGQVRP